jgi:hypothetical protein
MPTSTALALEIQPLGAQSAATRDGRRDFDFEIGAWNTHLRRLVRPLSGSKEWVEYEGTTVVREVWKGNANLVELDVTGPAGSIQALSLWLYNPESRQWSLNFASSVTGELSTPSVGEFRNGRGEFSSKGGPKRPADSRALRHLPHHGGLVPLREVLLG